MNKLTVEDIEPKGKRILMRVDFNVPLEDGIVRDSTRIERIAPTLEELASKGAIVVVLSHLGRPRGAVVPNMSLAPLVGPLSVATDRPVRFVARKSMFSQPLVQSFYQLVSRLL